MHDINNDLYNLAEQMNIEILSFALPETQSVSLENDDNYYIGIDNKVLKSATTERTHMAHELGHCMTGAFYTPFHQ